MTKECEEGVLIWKTPMTLANLAINLKELADESGVKITAFNQCMGNSETQYINVGKFAIFECYDGSNTKWELHYVSYINQYSINVKVCEYEETPPPTPCADHTTQTACETAGCFWYNDSCHTSDQEVTPEDLTNYERIKGDMDDSVAPVLTGITGVDQGIKDTKALINGVSALIGSPVNNLLSDMAGIIGSVGDSLQSGIDGLLGDLTGVIGGVQDYLSGEITTLTGSVSTGFTGIGDKIDGLKFPTLDSIKDVFLDVCEELAIALWNRIIDEIEKRYPDDEEE